MSRHRVTVAGVPAWVPCDRLLPPAAWEATDEGAVAAWLERADAADVGARLRGVSLGGSPIQVTIAPPLKRADVRAARTRDARARRDTTPGFRRGDTRLDEEGRWSLTPEALAVALGRRVAGASVVDAGCGAGGNAIGFARAGCAVVAIERDAARLAHARHNAARYDVADRIRFIEGDAVTEAARHPADVLFVDPPWGTAWDRARTTLADLPLLETLLGVFARSDHRSLIAKVPPSFAVDDLPAARPEAVFGEAPGDRHRVKFVLLNLARG